MMVSIVMMKTVCADVLLLISPCGTLCCVLTATASYKLAFFTVWLYKGTHTFSYADNYKESKCGTYQHLVHCSYAHCCICSHVNDMYMCMYTHTLLLVNASHELKNFDRNRRS